MRNKRTLIVSIAVALLIAAAWHSTAAAFFPLGAFNNYGSIRYAKWSDSMLKGGGVEIMFEGGPLGFTNTEIDILKDAFSVWEDVPTSYMSFKYVGVNEDPIFLGGEGFDVLNYVAMEWPDDPIQVGVTFPILGVCIYLFLVDDSWVETPGGAVWTTGGQIIKADIIINGPAHRSLVPGVAPEADLMGTMVHEIGHFIGLGHTPLNNLEVVLEDYNGEQMVALRESPAVALTDATGRRQWVGATPTMFPLAFEVEDNEFGGYRDGGRDLAPDDIAGISFLYPLGSQANFFTVSHNARTRTRDGFPSTPLGGGHVVAWADTDNNPLTRRIPLFSTMGGLYEIYPYNVGRFHLRGMYKYLEDPYGSAPFPASYTLTHSPLNEFSYARQAPFAPGAPMDSASFASIEGAAGAFMPPAWPSEVFHETGNILGSDNYDVGTELAFDSQRNTVVSTRTGKTMAGILPNDRPMFGHENRVCPMNVITAGMATQLPSQKIRAARDNIMLNSAWGTLAVDTYYRMSPPLARYMAENPAAHSVAQRVLHGVNWLMNHVELFLAAWVTLIALMLMRWRRATAAALVLIAAALLFALPAQARIMPVTDHEMDLLCDDIIIGKVTGIETVEPHAAGPNYLFTNVTVQTKDTVKAFVNKNSLVPLSVPGGRKGAMVTRATGFPQFREGQEVILYVKYQPRTASYAVVGGNRGTYNIFTDSAGNKFVTATSPEAATALNEAAKNVDSDKNPTEAAQKEQNAATKIPLDVYKNYLREISNRQKQP